MIGYEERRKVLTDKKDIDALIKEAVRRGLIDAEGICSPKDMGFNIYKTSGVDTVKYNQYASSNSPGDWLEVKVLRKSHYNGEWQHPGGNGYRTIYSNGKWATTEKDRERMKREESESRLKRNKHCKTCTC